MSQHHYNRHPGDTEKPVVACTTNNWLVLSSFNQVFYWFTLLLQYKLQKIAGRVFETLSEDTSKTEKMMGRAAPVPATRQP